MEYLWYLEMWLQDAVPSNTHYPYLHSVRRIVSSGMLRRVALVRTDVSEEPSSSFITVARISELGTTVTASVVPSSYLTGNTLHLRYRTQPVNAM
jgi:hypothetical protein